jgi:hypothetical protein
MEASMNSVPRRSADENETQRRDASTGATPRTKRQIRALLALMVLVNLAWSLYQLPLNRVIERRLCREFYLQHDPSKIDDHGNVPETACKLDEVQKGLGWTQGVMETTWVVGGELPLVGNSWSSHLTDMKKKKTSS